MILAPVVRNSPRLAVKRFFHISVGLKRVDGLKNLAQLVSGDGIGVCAALALEHVAVVAEALLVGLHNDVCGSQDGPGVINTPSVILDGPGMAFRQLDALSHQRIFGLGDSAVEGEIGRPLIALVDDALVVLLSDKVGHLLVSQSSA